MDLTDIEKDQIIAEHKDLLDTAYVEMRNFMENIQQMFIDLQTFSSAKNREEIGLKKEFNDCQDYIQTYISYIHDEIPDLIDVIKESEKEIQERNKVICGFEEELKQQVEEIHKLKEKCEEQTKRLDEMRQKYNYQVGLILTFKEANENQKQTIQDLQDKLEEEENDSSAINKTFTAALGSVLGTMLWKTSQSKEAIETYINAGTLTEFLNLANNTVASFRETYKTQLPVTDTFELKFITSLFGISINVVAQSIGREFLLKRDIGEEFINNVVAFLGDIPMPDGMVLKKLMLMLLYNLTMTKQGTALIQGCENSFKYLVECIGEQHSFDIKSIAARTLSILLNNAQIIYKFCIEFNTKLSKLFKEVKSLMEVTNDCKAKEALAEIISKIDGKFESNRFYD